MKADILFNNKFIVEHYRKGELIGTYECFNDITTEGKNFLLDVMFHGTTAATTWYVSLVNNTPAPSFAAGDTYDDINQAGNDWDEFENYTYGGDGTARGEWTEGAASGGSTTNATPITFVIAAGGGTVYGICVVGLGVNADTQGDHAADGKLWATAPFSGGAVTLSESDELKVTYTVNA